MKRKEEENMDRDGNEGANREPPEGSPRAGGPWGTGLSHVMETIRYAARTQHQGVPAGHEDDLEGIAVPQKTAELRERVATLREKLQHRRDGQDASSPERDQERRLHLVGLLLEMLERCPTETVALSLGEYRALFGDELSGANRCGRGTP